MKRLYIGIGLLTVMLVLGICLTAAFSSLYDPLTDRLEQARAAAIAGDWEDATAFCADARAQWQRMRHFSAAVTDHDLLEQMDALFDRLEVLARLREEDEFASDCAELSRLAARLGESQQVNWWHFL